MKFLYLSVGHTSDYLTELIDQKLTSAFVFFVLHFQIGLFAGYALAFSVFYTVTPYVLKVFSISQKCPMFFFHLRYLNKLIIKQSCFNIINFQYQPEDGPLIVISQLNNTLALILMAILQNSGSTLFNLSLLTSDMWAVAIRVVFYRQQVKISYPEYLCEIIKMLSNNFIYFRHDPQINWLYYLAFGVVAIGLIIYSLK